MKHDYTNTIILIIVTLLIFGASLYGAYELGRRSVMMPSLPTFPIQREPSGVEPGSIGMPPEELPSSDLPGGTNGSAPVACTMDAKICPDGSSVGRIPPACEFAPCPGE